MVKKLNNPPPEPRSGRAPGSRPDAPFAEAVKNSAQQIWQAGLGAFAKAQGEGSKVFETLAKEGLAIQRKTQAAAEEQIAEMTDRVTRLSAGVQTQAAPPWDRLESIFEDRVAKALDRLGVPSARDLGALIERIDALNARLDRLSPPPEAATGGPTQARTARKSKFVATTETAPKTKSSAAPAPRKAAARGAAAPMNSAGAPKAARKNRR